MRVGLWRRLTASSAALIFALLANLGPLSAAAIVGETTAEPEGELGATPATLAPTIGDGNDTVIEFTIQPSATDPDRMVTFVGVPQIGGKKVCVNHSATDLLVRAYTSDEESFTPTIPSEITGLTTGDSGQFVGFNQSKLFIKPLTGADLFDNPSECFVVDGLEGCFVPDDEDCDQQLTEGDYICVTNVIRRDQCPVIDHTNLERQLRIMLALNSPLGAEPIITAAGVTETPELIEAPDFEAGGLPGGFGAAPSFSTGFSGSGGGALIAVPNVVGLALSNAQSIITGVGLTVGEVTTSQQSSVGQLGAILIRPSYAQNGPSPNAEVVGQDPPAGELVPAGTAVNLITAAQAAIPEPSTFGLTAVGFGMIFLVVWVTRRRTAR